MQLLTCDEHQLGEGGRENGRQRGRRSRGEKSRERREGRGKPGDEGEGWVISAVVLAEPLMACRRRTGMLLRRKKEGHPLQQWKDKLKLK